MRLSECGKNKEMNLFPRIVDDITGFGLELTKGINNDQIILAVTATGKAFFITFDISKLTKNKQCNGRLRRKLTQTLIFPKSSYAIGLNIYSHRFIKKKYHEKCEQNTFSMSKAIRQTRLNHWTKEERKIKKSVG